MESNNKMNSEELKAYVKSLPAEISDNFSQKEYNNKKISVTDNLEDFFYSVKSIRELKERLNKFTDEALIELKAETDYHDDNSPYLEATVSETRLETDEELTERIMEKVKRLQKSLAKKKLKP